MSVNFFSNTYNEKPRRVSKKGHYWDHKKKIAKHHQKRGQLVNGVRRFAPYTLSWSTPHFFFGGVLRFFFVFGPNNDLFIDPRRGFS
jgi:hypothetical protein